MSLRSYRILLTKAQCDFIANALDLYKQANPLAFNHEDGNPDCDKEFLPGSFRDIANGTYDDEPEDMLHGFCL